MTVEEADRKFVSAVQAEMAVYVARRRAGLPGFETETPRSGEIDVPLLQTATEWLASLSGT